MAGADRYALITGSSRGIGRGIALALAQDGVKVAVHYFRDEAAAKETLAQVRKRGSDGMLVQADVTRPEDIAAMFRKVGARKRPMSAGRRVRSISPRSVDGYAPRPSTS